MEVSWFPPYNSKCLISAPISISTVTLSNCDLLSTYYTTMSSLISEKNRETRKRLESCWDMDLSWNLYPSVLKEVSGCFHVCYYFNMCHLFCEIVRLSGHSIVPS